SARAGSDSARLRRSSDGDGAATESVLGTAEEVSVSVGADGRLGGEVRAIGRAGAGADRTGLVADAVVRECRAGCGAADLGKGDDRDGGSRRSERKSFPRLIPPPGCQATPELLAADAGLETLRLRGRIDLARTAAAQLAAALRLRVDLGPEQERHRAQPEPGHHHDDGGERPPR